MMETLQQTYLPVQMASRSQVSLIHRFFNWCATQQKNRLLWVGAIIAGHGCIITPITLLFIMLAGNNMALWPFAMVAIAMSLVTNLAALPTRITIPVFLLSLLIDLALVINSVIFLLVN